MVSSTVTDLRAHRAALITAIGRQGMYPVAMEQDTAVPDGTVLDASLSKVRDAAAYVGIISHLYGRVPETGLNPNRLSLTELEFREARRLGRPILIFIMGPEHPVTVANVERDSDNIVKLQAFREDVKRSTEASMVHRVYQEFNNFHEFEVVATQSVAELRRHLEAQAQGLQSASNRRVSWPHRVGVVPAAVPGRLDRPADIALEVALSGQPDAGVRCQVLSGLGGVGKTQLAIEIAERWWQQGKVDLLVWVTANSRAAVLSRYAQAAYEVSGVNHGDLQTGADRFLAWLSTTHLHWLVILDDLTDPRDLTDLWPPTNKFGRSIVTTRRRDAALRDGRALIDVGVFTADEAVAYLSRKLGDQSERLEQAGVLAEELGRLPLALAQAAAYIVDQDLGCPDYLRRLHRRRLALLAPQALPDNQRKAVADTWALSIDLADRLYPSGLARPILELAALLDANTIPARLFVTDAVALLCAERVGQPIDTEDTHDAVRVLERLSLLALDDVGGTVRVHALVQRAVREAAEPDRLHAAARAAADGLCRLWPEVEGASTRAELLRLNATALYDHAASSLVGEEGDRCHPLLIRLGRSLGNAGLLADAFNYFRELQTIVSTQMGRDHPDTLAVRAEVADLQGYIGDRAMAVAALEELLADRTRVLGRYHLDTLKTRHNHAHWMGHAGKSKVARAAIEALLVDLLEVVGPDHPDVLGARGNLAYWRGESGDVSGAIEAMELVLRDRLRVLGVDHPMTLVARMSLAFWRGQAGDVSRAVAESNALLEDQLRLLGSSHPDVFATRSNIAYWRGQAGDVKGAVEAFEALQGDRVAAVGLDHPRTLLTRGNLAHWQGRSGHPDRAVAILEELVEEQHRLLGRDHRDSLGMRGSLGHWRGRAGNPAAAVRDLEAVLCDQIRVLGPDHLDTRATQAALRLWLVRLDHGCGADDTTVDEEVTGRRRHLSE